MENTEINIFNDFEVHSYDDCTSFFHIKLSDTNDFYNALFDYFFDEQRLLSYIENKKQLKFNPTECNFVSLYKHLQLYIDQHNEEIDCNSFNNEILNILQDEYNLEDKGDGKFKVRLDKMGKIGELIFSNILYEYFKFDCIIPKCHLTTDRNMNVYGIDTLYYSASNNMILFGESKLSKSLENGIRLIKESLKDYESNIKDEFIVVLSNRLYRDKFGKFGEKFNEVIEKCINIEQFIELAEIKKIGVPIFIAHGKDNIISNIFDQLKKIQKDKLFGLDTIYFLISLPILNKSKFIATFTKRIREKREFYERSSVK